MIFIEWVTPFAYTASLILQQLMHKRESV